MPVDGDLRRKRQRAHSTVLLWTLAAILLAALAVGLEQVVYAPLQTGERYPAFSSLRPDPEGSLALYDSLSEMPGIRVDRLYKSRQKLAPEETMFILGVDSSSWAQLKFPALKEYEKLVEDGGRLVIGFLPERTRDTPEIQPVELGWRIKLVYRDYEQDRKSGGHTALFFKAKDGWQSIAIFDDSIEAAEKSFGKGSIVLVADAYSLCNQGLRYERDAAFIAKLVGNSTRITFDENHFGVIESGSIVKLMRRYRLHGAIAVLLAVAILFLWRAASSLLTPRSAGHSKSAVAGRDSLAGLASLLHRGVPEKQLLETCFAEWSKSSTRGSMNEKRAEQVRAEIAAHPDSPVDAYRGACRILTEHTQ